MTSPLKRSIASLAIVGLIASGCATTTTTDQGPRAPGTSTKAGLCDGNEVACAGGGAIIGVLIAGALILAFMGNEIEKAAGV